MLRTTVLLLLACVVLAAPCADLASCRTRINELETQLARAGCVNEVSTLAVNAWTFIRARAQHGSALVSEYLGGVQWPEIDAVAAQRTAERWWAKQSVVLHKVYAEQAAAVQTQQIQLQARLMAPPFSFTAELATIVSVGAIATIGSLLVGFALFVVVKLLALVWATVKLVLRAIRYVLCCRCCRCCRCRRNKSAGAKKNGAKVPANNMPASK